MKRPDKAGDYWWRVDASCSWEPVTVKMNSEGDLWCAFAGKCKITYLECVGGEWLGEAHPPKSVKRYAMGTVYDSGGPTTEIEMFECGHGAYLAVSDMAKFILED